MTSSRSVGSLGLGSGYSGDALQAGVRVKNATSSTKIKSPVIKLYGSGQGDRPNTGQNTRSPRRSKRENLSFIRDRHRSNSYKEIGEIPEHKNDIPDDLQFSELVRQAEEAIEAGVYPTPIDQGSSGSYFVKKTRRQSDWSFQA